MKKIAVVIGLQYFSNYRLNGCYNDTNNIIKTIKNIYNFKNDEIIYLTDKYLNNGTKKIITNTLNSIARSDYDFIFIYYAGHGSYIKDYDNDEDNIVVNENYNKINKINNNNNSDSYMVTNEGRSISKITDDEINLILSQVKKDAIILGFFDCCHSGTMFDCIYTYFPNKINRKYCKKKNLKYLENNYFDEFELLSTKYNNPNKELAATVLLFSGARDTQYSYESKKFGITSGNFTRNLCNLLYVYKTKKLSIEQIILMISGMVDDPKQVPVLTCSKDIDLSNSYLCTNDNLIPTIKNNIQIEKNNMESRKTDQNNDNKVNYGIIIGLMGIIAYKYTKK